MATIYCGPAGTGAQTGANFSNLMQLPTGTGWSRSNTYVYIGSVTGYGGRSFSTAVSGSTVITVRKANAAQDSGVTGWSSSFETTPANMGALSWFTSFWILDGISRDESNWKEASGYGTLMTGSAEGFIDAHVSNITVRFLAKTGNDLGSDAGFRHTNQEGVPWRTIINYESCLIGNVGIAIFSRETSHVTIDRCWIGPCFSKEAISHQYGGNWIIKNSYFVDCACGTGADQLTAIIGMFNFSGGGSQQPSDTQVENGAIYGCVFASTTPATQAFSDGLISIISTGWVFYNCTVVDPGDSGPSGSIRLFKNGGAGTSNTVKNVLCYNVPSPSTNAEVEDFFWANTTNSFTGTVIDGDEDPFVDLAQLDYTLKSSFTGPSPLGEGEDLGSPYNVDINGNDRGTGAWDIGAFTTDGDPPPGDVTVNTTNLTATNLVIG